VVFYVPSLLFNVQCYFWSCGIWSSLPRPLFSLLSVLSLSPLLSLPPSLPSVLESSRSSFRSYFPALSLYISAQFESFVVHSGSLPEVRVSGSENPYLDGQDVDMSGTQGETNDRNESNTGNETGGRNEGEGEGEQQSQQDAALLDAPAEQADPTPAEPPTPAKKPQDLRFLE
jgi:hypothetical protein